MLIDFTYFDNALCRVAGINATSHGEPTAAALQLRADIGTMLGELEPRYLCALLGGDWTTVVKRDEVAAILVDKERHTSPIAKYVWCAWTRLNATRNTAAGEKIKDGEYSSSANVQNRIVEVWNSMVDDNISAVAALSKLDGITIAPDFTSEIFQKRNIFGL